jgi:hypothetical protein
MLINSCKELEVNSLTIRKLTIPNNIVNDNPARWIMEHADDKYYNGLISEFNTNYIKNGLATEIRETNFGTKIFDCNGISFSYSDYCIQEKHNDEDVRSLIFVNDGHMYTLWDRKASLLF